MKNKISTWLVVFGWAIIIGSLARIAENFIRTIYIRYDVYLLLSNLVGSISVFPRGLYWFIGYLLRPNAIVAYQFIMLWTIIILVCGIGILLRNNLLRIIFISLNIAHVILFISSRLVFLIASYPNKHYATGSALIDILIKVNYNFLTLAIPLVYIIYFTRPSVKKLFK
jgi:hypothetical protein